MGWDSRVQWKACRVLESPGGRAVRLCEAGGVQGREGAGRAGARSRARGGGDWDVTPEEPEHVGCLRPREGLA